MIKNDIELVKFYETVGFYKETEPVKFTKNFETEFDIKLYAKIFNYTRSKLMSGKDIDNENLKNYIFNKLSNNNIKNKDYVIELGINEAKYVFETMPYKVNIHINKKLGNKPWLDFMGKYKE